MLVLRCQNEFPGAQSSLNEISRIKCLLDAYFPLLTILIYP